MKRVLIFLVVMTTVIIMGCKDDDGAERTIIIAGDPEGAFYYSDIPEPDTMIFSGIHMTTRDFDLNNDGVMDISFVAERDTTLDGDTPSSTTKALRIRATDPSDNPVFISTLGDDVRAYSRGQVINRNNAIWTTLTATPLVLTEIEQNLTSGQTDETGNWNGLREQCIGFILPQSPEIMMWFEMGVLNGDSWIYNDHAAFTLD